MELLQTIWNALTNENEVLMNIISVPMTFIEISLTFLLFTTVLNISFTKKQAILYIVLSSSIGLILPYIIPSPFHTFINILVLPILVYLILKTNILKAISAEVVIYGVLFLCGILLITLYTSFSGLPANVFSTIPIHRLIYSASLYLILFLIYKIIKAHNIHFTLLDKFEYHNQNALALNFIVGIVVIAMQSYISFIYIDYLPNNLVYCTLIMQLAYYCISLYSLYRTNKLESTTQLLEEEKMYNKTLNTLHDNIRGFKHDFNNIVQAIGGYLSTNNIDGLKTYYKDLLEECQINNNLAVLNPELVNNPAIYSLLADKLGKAEKDHIKLNYEVMTDLSNLNIKTYELTRILGILFDNALEAASKCDKKIVNVTFRTDKSHSNKTLIIIQNTYSNKDVNIDRIFEKGYTSKTDCENHQSHGLGLWEVRKYLSKNTSLDLYTTKSDMFFTQQFEIYN